MKFIYLTAITLLPIATADIAIASDGSHFYQSDRGLITLYNSGNDSVLIRQGLPERRISGSSR
ncbi:MAG: hypothetical protein AAF821_04440 [Cyanobacteria bacterium P01_D01_bin.156]